MFYRYSTVSETATSENGQIFKVYGISVRYEEKGTIKIRTVHDISPNRQAIEQLVKLFNEHQLDVCHLDDVIEDFICEQYR